jgi:multidrug efflux pump
VIGVVVIGGVTLATSLTLFVIPCAYKLMAVRTASPRAAARELEQQLKESRKAV